MKTYNLVLLPAAAALLILSGCSLSAPDRFSPDSGNDIGEDRADILMDADIPSDPTIDLPYDPPVEWPDIHVDVTEIIDVELHEVIPDTPVEEAVACEPGSTRCLPDGSLEVCNDEGTGTYIVSCPFGCSYTPEAHCLELVPSNVENSSLLCLPGTSPIAISADAAIVIANTDAGGIYQLDAEGEFIGPPIRGEGEGLIDGINFETQTQPGDAPDIGIFSVQRLTVPAGVALVGIGDNALVIFSCENVDIRGYIVVGSIIVSDDGDTEYIIPGPGGSYSGEGPGAGLDGRAGGMYTSGGGGGGSFGGNGGNGATGSIDSSSGAGGEGGGTYGDEDLAPLFGGSGGGRGADNNDSSGYGGPAGGAVQISTPATITVHPGGAIEACGWGGMGSSPGGAGGGAGSGGGILLEAHTINVTTGCIVASNGGGGGSSGQYSSIYGNHGEKGTVGLASAPGGEAPNDNACRGGSGSSATNINGETPPCSNRDGGGGGGGAGRIRLNAMEHNIGGPTTSPSLTAASSTTTTADPHLR